MGRSRESRRAPAAAAFTFARVTPVVAILLLASALPGALASDYEGDYALYSGHHAKCSSVMYGVSQPAVQVSSANTAFRDDSIFYARFHVRTPYRFLPERPSDHSGSQPNSTTYNLFVFGGSDANERGCDGWFGGVEADPNDSKRGYLFFGHRDCFNGALTKYVGTERWVWNGESTRVEFSYFRADSTLRMYVDGELTYENFAASLPEPSPGPLSIGVGGHASTSSTIDAWDSGGCFSPNVPNWSPRDGARPDAEPECETRNRWDEIDGGDLLWCPSGWTGAAPSPTPVQPSRAAFKPSDGGCDAQLFAPHAPMYTKDSSEAWQRNRLRTKYAADPTKVDLRDLGEYPDFEDKFVYARFSFTTPEYFGRPHHSWGGYVEDQDMGDYARGKIRLFGMGNHESLMGPSPQDNRFASCVSLVAVSPPGVPPDAHIPIRQVYNRAKIVIHECSEAKFNGGGIYAKNFEVTSSYLEPSTSYLLEIKFNYRSSERTVDVYLQGRMVASGPFDFFPCKRTTRSDLGCDLSQDSNYPHSVWFGDNAPLSYSLPSEDVNHWPGVVSAGNPGEVFTFMTDWGGLFSRAWSADGDPTDDWACVHDGKCGYLTGAQGTWGNWTSGELHFCPYPPDGPVAPTFDRDMYVATHACENCFPANESLGSGVLIGPFVGLTDADSIADDRLFRVVSATMSGEDAGGSSTPARVARFFSDIDQPAQEQIGTASYIVWTCDAAARELKMVKVTFRDRDGVVRAVAEGASTWSSADSNVDDDEFCNLRDYVVNDRWEDASSASTPTSVATGHAAQGLGVSSIVVEAYLPVEVFSTTPNDFDTFATTGDGTSLRDPRAMPVMGYLAGGGLRGEHGGSIVHVMDANEASAACAAGTSGRRRALLQKRREPSTATVAAAAAGKKTERARRRRAIESSTRRPSTTTATTRTPSRNARGRALLQGPSYSWPTQADACVAFETFYYCTFFGGASQSACEDTNSLCNWVENNQNGPPCMPADNLYDDYMALYTLSFMIYQTEHENCVGSLNDQCGGNCVWRNTDPQVPSSGYCELSYARKLVLVTAEADANSNVPDLAVTIAQEDADREQCMETASDPAVCYSFPNQIEAMQTACTATVSGFSGDKFQDILDMMSGGGGGGGGGGFGPTYSWPSQAEACTGYELNEYCRMISMYQNQCPSQECSWDGSTSSCVPLDASATESANALDFLMYYDIYQNEDNACRNGQTCDTGAGCTDDIGYCRLSDAKKVELVQAYRTANPSVPEFAVTLARTDALGTTCQGISTNAQDCEDAGCTAGYDYSGSSPVFLMCYHGGPANEYGMMKTACESSVSGFTGSYFQDLMDLMGGGGGGGGGGSNSDSPYDSLIARYASIPYYPVADMCAAWEIQLFCSATSGSQAECTHSECQWGLRDIASDPNDLECLANNPTFNSTYVEMQWKIRSLHADQDDICRQRSSSSECTLDATCAFMSDWGTGGECVASYSFITNAVASDGAPLHIQTFAKLDNLDRLCEPLDPASCDSEPKCSYDSDRGSCGTDAQYYIGNALSTDACDSYADFSLLLAAFSDSGSPPPQPPQDSVVGSTLWETSTNFTELTDAVGLVATCDYPFDDADLSGEGTMKMVLFDLTHDGAETLVKPLEAGEKANVAGCHYKVHDVDEVTAAWKCRANATLATTAFTPDAFSLRTITYLKSSVVSTRPYSQSDVEEAALEGVCECADQYVKHGFLDVA